MWTCPTCGEEHEDQFEECWKCAGDRFSKAPGIPLRCLRCEIPLTLVGIRSFHLKVVQQEFELFTCERCGKVEFYLPDVGREHRPLPVEP